MTGDKATFRCAACGGEFGYEWSDDEAVAEYEQSFGEFDSAETDVVCDDCYNHIMSRTFPDVSRTSS